MIPQPELCECRRVESSFEFIYRCGDRFVSARVALVAGRPFVEFPHYAGDLGTPLGDPAADEAVVAETIRLIAEWDGQAAWQVFRREAR